MIIEMSLIGFLFVFILVTLFASIAFGNDIGDFDSDDRLQKINNNPKKFKISIVIALIEWVRIIALAIMLFIVFSPYNLILGVVGTIFRIGEGLPRIHSEINSWGLLNIARQYSGSSGAEKNGNSPLEYYQRFMKRTINKIKSNEKKQAKRYASNQTLEQSLSSFNMLKDGIGMLLANQINKLLPAEQVILLPT